MFRKLTLADCETEVNKPRYRATPRADGDYDLEEYDFLSSTCYCIVPDV